MKLTIEVPPQLEAEIKKRAQAARHPPEKLAGLVLEWWLKEGSLWPGRKRIVIDWPAEYSFAEKGVV
ncbi:MAG: hypothetical protein HY558_01540 [Euryarchaeota archaeon]|nr:hypothetical protein [Euryarchaeota archaeon]